LSVDNGRITRHKALVSGVYHSEPAFKKSNPNALNLEDHMSITSSVRSLRFLVLLPLLTLFLACYPDTPVTYSNPQQLSISQWLIEMPTGDNQVQLSMRYSRKRDGYGSGYSNTDFRVPFDQLVGLTREQAMSSGSHVQFQLKRDAGVFNFEGWFKEGNGSGHFTISPNATFAADLSRQGLGKATDEQLLSMALGDAGYALISELRSQGYDLSTVEQLVRMAEHGVRLDYVQGLKSLGYSLKSVDFLVKMRDHGVNLNFIHELAGLGFTGLSAEDLIRTRDHGVSARFINEFIAAGYSRATLEDWITLKDHGVSTEFVSALKDLGYTRLDLDTLLTMKDHGVSASFIKELKDIGYDSVPVEQLVRLKDHGVSAAYIKRLKDRGYGDLSLDEFIQLRDRGTKDE
jgi:hypothetical protein